MPGPTPKDPALRQRRNRISTAATLLAERPARKRAPSLPRDREWHRLTRAWWRDVWHSPMAAEYLQADLHGLFILAALVDQFWTAPTKELAAEIRLQRQCFGLTPIDRRRLQWEVERVEAATQRQRRRRDSEPSGAEDPRRILRLA